MSRPTRYADDRGEMATIGRQVEDFLPSPADLAMRDATVKVTLALSLRGLAFFKCQAARQRVPCQHMIRALIDDDAKRQMERDKEQD